MKLIKAISLQRKLRRRQEYLHYQVCKWSELLFEISSRGIDSPYLSEYISINNAVRRINKKLPWVYFILSDIFGFSKSLRYTTSTKPGIYNPSDLSLIAYDLISNPGFKTKL